MEIIKLLNNFQFKYYEGKETYINNKINKNNTVIKKEIIEDFDCLKNLGIENPEFNYVKIFNEKI